jgi:hypothetical protein
MTWEEIKETDIPHKVKALQENIAIYEAAKKLLTLGVGRAIRVKPEGDLFKRVGKKAHVYFRQREYRLRTKQVDGYLYMWIERRDPARFGVVGVPTEKAEKRV